MLTSTSILILYFALKGAAYCFWCALGVRRFRPDSTHRIGLAVGLGGLRLALGLGFGVLIFLASNLLVAGLGESGGFDASAAMVLAYLAVYVPVRWIEWGIIEALLSPPARRARGFVLGTDAGARRWRQGGVAISCLADVPLIIAAGGLPIGRFMC